MLFADRQEAGRKLARELARYDSEDTVLYALPRGGVPVAVEAARELEVPMELLLARKIGHPDNSEYAVCAVSEDDVLICSETERARLDPDWLKEEQGKALEEALRRRQVYGRGRPRLPATGKLVIIVDDGIATGLTTRAAIRTLRAELPDQIVVASPLAPREVREVLAKEADDVVILDTSEPFLGSVGAYYQSFPQISDEEVIVCLDRASRV